MQKEEIISKLKSFFKEKSHQYNIELVFLYGSWARGYPHQDSDIDLAIIFSSKIKNEEDKFNLITDISYKLSECLNQEVNIILIHRDFRRPMLYYNAIILGIPIFVANEDELLNWKLEAITQMEDFQIFALPWQLEIANRLFKEASYD